MDDRRSDNPDFGLCAVPRDGHFQHSIACYHTLELTSQPGLLLCRLRTNYHRMKTIFILLIFFATSVLLPAQQGLGDDALTFYGELRNRTILRPAGIPSVPDQVLSQALADMDHRKGIAISFRSGLFASKFQPAPPNTPFLPHRMAPNHTIKLPARSSRISSTLA